MSANIIAGLELPELVFGENALLARLADTYPHCYFNDIYAVGKQYLANAKKVALTTKEINNYITLFNHLSGINPDQLENQDSLIAKLAHVTHLLKASKIEEATLQLATMLSPGLSSQTRLQQQ